MTHLVLITSLAVAAIFFALAIHSLRQRRWLSTCRHAGTGLLLASMTGLALALGLNFYTYQRLTNEQEVAGISVRALTPGHFQLTATFPGQHMRQFDLRGDAWQLDARILKWKGPATLLGLDARYRLERLSSRYADIDAERRSPHSIYALAEGGSLDIWTLAHEYSRWLPFVDAVYGSATYLPLADGAQYEVRITQSGLIARPLNPSGQAAVRNWR